MKKLYALLVFVLSILMVSTSYSQLLVEDFNYTAGDSLTNHGWVAHSGAGTNPITVNPYGLVFPGYISSGIGLAGLLDNTGEDINKLFTTVSDGSVYTSFMMQVNVAPTGYFIHYTPNPHNTTDFRGRVWIKTNGLGDLAIGFSYASSDTLFTNFDYQLGDTLLVVSKCEVVAGANNDIVSLYVFDNNTTAPLFEPLIPTVGPITNLTASVDVNPGSISLRQYNATQNIIVDGIRIGTSWSEVIKGIPSLTIAEAREDLDLDRIPDRLGDTVLIHGTVISPNYQTTNHSYYIWDGTAGITEYLFGTTSPALNFGDSVAMVGFINHYRGLTELELFNSDGVSIISSGNSTPAPVVLTLAQYKANPEAYEGTLVGFVSLSKVSGTWPTSGSVTLKVTDGVDTVDFRIDSDTDIDGNPEPAWPADLIGIGSQFSSGTTVYNDGYQILPRYFATDILPAGTIPVELTSFAASINGTSVTLNWTTATELNNSGFNVERKSASSSWAKIGFVPGYGTTTETRKYSFSDNNLISGNYSYRLKQVDYNGAYEYSNVVEVEIITPNKFELSQNFPNPFNPTTSIKFNLPEAGNVKLAVYNLLGQEVKMLVNGFKSAGVYTINFDGKELTSGVYLYKLEANGINAVRKMTLLK